LVSEHFVDNCTLCWYLHTLLYLHTFLVSAYLVGICTPYWYLHTLMISAHFFGICTPYWYLHTLLVSAHLIGICTPYWYQHPFDDNSPFISPRIFVRVLNILLWDALAWRGTSLFIGVSSRIMLNDNKHHTLYFALCNGFLRFRLLHTGNFVCSRILRDGTEHRHFRNRLSTPFTPLQERDSGQHFVTCPHHLDIAGAELRTRAWNLSWTSVWGANPALTDMILPVLSGARMILPFRAVSS
jgi:hypothetical protein